ncbi:MAG TPA: protein phosphatase 2C domain-containing protein [Rhodocyclaceae bacterium]|nr:protein phosphatase 2C domain-containing protein [Rhodocyclaceae bacterium]
MLALQTTYISETGQRKRNEDTCGYWTSDAACCWVVSDGAGGHGSGDIASQLVVDTTLTQFEAKPEISQQVVTDLTTGAHAAVMDHKHRNPQGDDMHATVAILLIDAETRQAVWANVGDTRIYLFRRGKLTMQTRDHSLVQQLIDAGYGNTDIIRSHPQRNMLTSAIGTGDDMEISVSGAPILVEEGDVFLMCTDGWWEYVEEHAMEEMLHDTTATEEWLQVMARQVEALAKENADNYTAIAVQVS